MRAQRRQLYAAMDSIDAIDMFVIDVSRWYELPSPSVEQCHAIVESKRAWWATERPFASSPFARSRSLSSLALAREPHTSSQRQRRYGAREVAYHCTAKQNKLGITFPVQALRSASLPFFHLGGIQPEKGNRKLAQKIRRTAKIYKRHSIDLGLPVTSY